MMRRLRARAGDRSLFEVLSRAGEGSSAVADGRVFLERRRVVDPNLAVSAGDEIWIAKDDRAGGAVELLDHRDGFFAFLKPAGLPTIPGHRGNASVLHSAARELGVKPSELHAVTRLDTNVSGIVLVARGSDAMRRAAALRESGGLRRRYIGLAAGAPSPERGTWDGPIAVPPSRGASSGRAAKSATTHYASIVVRSSKDGPVALVAFEPVTGRTHQIRIHSSASGAPLVGDRAYGGPRRIVLVDGVVLPISRVALHAARVESDPGSDRAFHVRAPHPEDLVAIWLRLGGASSDFDRAECAAIRSGERARRGEAS